MSSPNRDEPGRNEAHKSFVHCRRTGQDYDIGEHRRCPYCYGDSADVASGDHGVFCDFDPEKDPVDFGFPQDSSRNERG